MILQPIDFVVYAWLAIAVLSALYVAWDQFRHNPEARLAGREPDEARRDDRARDRHRCQHARGT